MKAAVLLQRGSDRGGRFEYRGVQLPGPFFQWTERFLQPFSCGLQLELPQAFLHEGFAPTLFFFSPELPAQVRLLGPKRLLHDALLGVEPMVLQSALCIDLIAERKAPAQQVRTRKR